MKMLRISGIVLGLCLGAIGYANASTLDYSFTLSGSGFSGSGSFTVTSGVVQTLTGTVDGSKLQLIAPDGSNTFTQFPLSWSYDDKFHTSGAAFDSEGLLFKIGSNVIGDIYSLGSQLYLSVSNPGSDFSGVKISMTVSQTPLPAGLPLFLTGIVGLWFLFFRKGKKVSDTSITLGRIGAT